MKTSSRIYWARQSWRFYRRSPFWLQLALALVGFRFLRRALIKRFR